MPNLAPSPEAAAEAARQALGWTDVAVSRFTTGSAFFVYEVARGDQLAVVRMGLPAQAQDLVNGVALSRQLRPLGVPLAELLASDTGAALPYIVLSRLPGTDLGHVVRDLSRPARERVARAVADAQLATGRLGAGTRFGYAPRAAVAPHESWADVVAASIERSRQRIAANGLFPVDAGDPLLRAFERHRPALAAMPPLPFLHDTTTKNVIVSPDGRLSGIVDVDDLCFGDPRYAAALTRASLVAHDGPADYVDIWLAHAGLADDAVFAFYVALFLFDFMAEHGMVFNGNAAPSEPGERDRLARIYARTLNQIP